MKRTVRTSLFTTRRLRRRSPQGKVASLPLIDLKKLALGSVPAHGFSVISRGMNGTGVGFLSWMKKLLGAISIAGMIALGLFVYTEFTQTWEKRGLPVIPISALSALDQMTRQEKRPGYLPSDNHGVNHSQERRDGRHRPFSLMDDYVG